MTTTTSDTIWSAGHNLAGYLPEMTPDVCETSEEARDALTWYLDSLADFLAEGCDEEEDESEGPLADLAACEEALNELAGVDLIADGGFLAYVGYSAYWISPIPRAEWPDELCELVDAGETLADALQLYSEGGC